MMLPVMTMATLTPRVQTSQSRRTPTSITRPAIAAPATISAPTSIRQIIIPMFPPMLVLVLRFAEEVAGDSTTQGPQNAMALFMAQEGARTRSEQGRAKAALAFGTGHTGTYVRITARRNLALSVSAFGTVDLRHGFVSVGGRLLGVRLVGRVRSLLVVRRVGIGGAPFRILRLLAVTTLLLVITSLLRRRRVGSACCWGLRRVAFVGRGSAIALGCCLVGVVSRLLRGIVLLLVAAGAV